MKHDCSNCGDEHLTKSEAQECCSSRWECTDCGFDYSKRASAATCCIAPGRPPNYTTAKPVKEPDVWLGPKIWED